MSKICSNMDFHSVMETFAEAWVAANTHTPLTVAAEQGLINGPNNHGPPSRALPAHSASGHPSGQTISNHPSAAHNTPVSGPVNLETVHHDSPVATHNQNSVHHSNSILCPLQNVSPERKDIESSESDCRNVDRNSEDSPNNITDLRSSFPTLSKPHGKSLPVHCIVEQIPGPQACGQHVELDSYAIVPCDTPFNDLVRTALGKLGYSTSQILGAKGCIQIKKWKPLAFDQITENLEATVADILGELSTVASLHVRLYSVPEDPQEWKDITVRNAVLELLREMSQSKLAKLCPLSQPMLSNIINNRYMGKIGKEKCQEFGSWYLNYRKQNPESSILEVVPSERPADGRLTFHPVKELPIMREWFQSCRNPSRRTLQMYVDILNQGPVRQQERPKIAFATLKNWWKNEKQRERKQLRGDEKVDDPEKPKKRKKISLENSTNLKEVSNEHNLTSSTTDSHSGIKSTEFTLINHSENESDVEKNEKKDYELTDASNSVDATSISPEGKKSSSNFSIINFTDTNKFLNKDIIVDENSKNNCSDALQLAKNSSTYHKIPVNMCLDHNSSLFPFSDPNLSVHNCSKPCCDNTERTSAKEESNSNHASSEEDVDIDMAPKIKEKPTKFSKKQPKFCYTQEAMNNAINAVRRQNMTILKASKQFGVPRSTLINKMKSKTPNIRRMGPSTILTNEEEERIVNWILDIAKAGFPLKREDLLNAVQHIITEKKISTPFTNNRPGRKWYQLFLARHPILTKQIPEILTPIKAKKCLQQK